MIKTPYIGQLDRKIQIIKEEVTRATTGEEKPVDAIVIQPYAFMEELSGDEDVEGKVIHLTDRKYTIRYHSDVLANGYKYFVVDGGLKFTITHVKEIGRNHYLQLLVKRSE